MIFLIYSSDKAMRKWIKAYKDTAFGEGSAMIVNAPKDFNMRLPRGFNVYECSCKKGCTISQKLEQAYQKHKGQQWYAVMRDTDIPKAEDWDIRLMDACLQYGFSAGFDMITTAWAVAPFMRADYVEKWGICHPTLSDMHMWKAYADLAQLNQCYHVDGYAQFERHDTEDNSQIREYVNWKRTVFREIAREKGKAIPPIVMIAVPTSGNVTAAFADYKASMQKTRDFIIYWKYAYTTPVSATRSLIVEEFLNSDADYLLMIDNDVEPHPRVLDMVYHKKPICAAHVNFIFSRGEEGVTITPAFGRLHGKDEKGVNKYIAEGIKLGNDGHLQEVDVVGTGCILIRRDVLENWIGPYFQFRFQPDGKLALTEDYEFCERAKQQGHTIWVDTSIWCPHRKEVVI